MLNALDALRDANLMSPRPNEWATLQEVNAAADSFGDAHFTHGTLSKLVKAGSAESATIDGQTMYRAAGQAIRPGGGGDTSEPRPEPDQEYDPGQGPRGGKPEDGKPPYLDEEQYLRGGPAVPAPVGGIVSGVSQQIMQ